MKIYDYSSGIRSVDPIGTTMTGEIPVYTKVTLWYDGTTTMTATQVDGVIYVQKGTDFFKRNVDQLPYLSVRWFGATGDGVTDDTVAINSCISIAAALGKDVFLPAGTYLCNTTTTGASSGNTVYALRIDRSGTTRMKLFGEKGTKITSTSTFSSFGGLFMIYNNVVDAVIENIFFQSTHALTTNYFYGIFFSGTTSNNIKNTTIRNCRFEGFPVAVFSQGVSGFTIDNCIFEAPRGHDDATNDLQPAVYVRFQDAGAGTNTNIQILNCNANGYTGAAAVSTMTTKRAMDGFVWGAMGGAKFSNNVTKNFSEEHYDVNGTVGLPSANIDYPTEFLNNQLYCLVLTGSVKSAAPLLKNYGIRADGNNVHIRCNTFYDFTQGILCFPGDSASHTANKSHGIKIESNVFISPRSAVPDVEYAINISGNTASNQEAYNIEIQNNTFDIDTITLVSYNAVITLASCEKIIIQNNNIWAQNITPGAFQMAGIVYNNCKTIIDNNNLMSGLGAAFYTYAYQGTTVSTSISDGYNSSGWTYPKQLIADNTVHSFTGTTTQTTLATYTIKSGDVLKNGSLDFDYFVSCTNSVNNKTFEIQINGNVVSRLIAAGSVIGHVFTRVFWRNSTTLYCPGLNSPAGVGFSVSTTAPVTYTVDPTADMTVTVKVTLALGTETGSLESMRMIGCR